VVDVAEDGHDRRARAEVLGHGLPGLELQHQFLFHRRLLRNDQVHAVLQRDRLRRLHLEPGVNVDVAHTLHEQLAHDLGALDPEDRRQALHRDRLLDLDRLAALRPGLGQHVLPALGALFQVAVEGGADGGCVAEADAALLEVGLAELAQLLHGLAAAAVGPAAALGVGPAGGAAFLQRLLACLFLLLFADLHAAARLRAGDTVAGAGVGRRPARAHRAARGRQVVRLLDADHLGPLDRRRLEGRELRSLHDGLALDRRGRRSP
jgi:hypothetical protein